MDFLNQQLAEQIAAFSKYNVASIHDEDATAAELDSGFKDLTFGPTFTCFPKLPLEIRRQIWKQAIPTGM